MTNPTPLHHDNDMRQFTGHFDASVVPSPDFAEKLRARLEREQSEIRRTNERDEPLRPPVAMKAIDTHASPATTASAASYASEPNTRFGWAWISAALLVIGLLAGSLWWNLTDRGTDNTPPPSRYAAQVVDPSATPTVLEARALANAPVNMLVTRIENDVAYGFAPSPDDASSGLVVAYSLADEKLLWERPESEFGTVGNIQTDGSTLIAIQWSTTASDGNGPAVSNGSEPISVVALDAATGKTLWQSDPIINDRQPDEGVWIEPSEPAFIGDTVYVGTSDGQVNAFEIRTGERIDTPGLTPPDGVGESLFVQSDGMKLFAAFQDGAIWTLDPSQDTEWQAVATTNAGQDEFRVRLFEQEGVLISVSFGTADSTTSMPSAVRAYDSKTLELLWERDVSAAWQNITATDTTIASSDNYGWSESRPWYLRWLPGGEGDAFSQTAVEAADLRTGDTIFSYQVGTEGDATGNWIPAAAIDGGICYEMEKVISCDIPPDITYQVAGIELPADEYAHAPMVSWDGDVLVSTSEGLYLIDLP